MGSKTKQVAGVVAAPVTGGASLALTAKGIKEEKKEKEARRKSAAIAAEEEAEQRAELETENKRLSKELDIATRSKRKQGLSALVGDSEDTTLG